MLFFDTKVRHSPDVIVKRHFSRAGSGSKHRILSDVTCHRQIQYCRNSHV